VAVHLCYGVGTTEGRRVGDPLGHGVGLRPTRNVMPPRPVLVVVVVVWRCLAAHRKTNGWCGLSAGLLGCCRGPNGPEQVEVREIC